MISSENLFKNIVSCYYRSEFKWFQSFHNVFFILTGEYQRFCRKCAQHVWNELLYSVHVLINCNLRAVATKIEDLIVFVNYVIFTDYFYDEKSYFISNCFFDFR